MLCSPRLWQVVAHASSRSRSLSTPSCNKNFCQHQLHSRRSGSAMGNLFAAPEQKDNCIPVAKGTRQWRLSQAAGVHYLECGDAARLSLAIADIEQHGICVMDCEGLDLGSAGSGVLSTVQVIPVPADGSISPAYIIDVLKLRDSGDLQPLQELIQVPGPGMIRTEIVNWPHKPAQCSGLL